MENSVIPAIVREKLREYGLNRARKILASDKQYGDVYELYYEDGSSELTQPTGMPVLISYKDGTASKIETNEAFAILETISS